MPSTIMKKANSIEAMMMDSDIPLEHRRHMLATLCADDSEASQKLIASLLQKAAQNGGESLYARKLEELTALKKAMESAPLRIGTFIRMLDAPPTNGNGINGNGSANGDDGHLQFNSVPRALVKLEDGASACTVVPDPKMVNQLEVGATVLIEAQGRVLMHLDSFGHQSGEEAKLERRIDAHRVEVTLRDQDRILCLASATLARKLDAGEVVPGAWLLVCPRRNIAFDAVPRSDRFGYYQFLSQKPVPDVIVERDIGDPPAFIEKITQHIRFEMTQPERLRRYRLPRSKSVLLHGPSGTGKSLSIDAVWRRTYEVTSEVTGIPIDQLPPRVILLRAAMLLSMWYGKSEKLIDKCFDEIEEIASETITGADGREYTAPTLVICEEADALGRARGQDGTHDRVQNTLLDRFDLARQNLRDRLIIFMFSTNFPQHGDAAFLRRAAGTSVSFGRLSQRGFCAVFDKHLRDVPVHQNGDASQADALRRLKNEVASWLFSTRGEDKGIIEFTFAGATHPEVRYRRDFLTGAVVRRAVLEAADEACFADTNGIPTEGVTAGQLIVAFDRQIRALCDQLHAGNLDQYVAMPDGARVANLRRIPQPPLLAVEAMR
jgi:ATP-dependent 26S proteasome regulatory subunit